MQDLDVHPHRAVRGGQSAPDNARRTSRLHAFIETETAEKLPWATTPAKRSFERFPAMEDYAGLMQDYQDSMV